MNPTPIPSGASWPKSRGPWRWRRRGSLPIPKTPAALYALGISDGLRSDYYWVVKKSWRDSLKDATAARKLHNRVTELEPDNVDARLVQGLHDYIVGSLPLAFRMLGFLVGIQGDKAKGHPHGRRTWPSTANRQPRSTPQIFLCALYRRENQTARPFRWCRT